MALPSTRVPATASPPRAAHPVGAAGPNAYTHVLRTRRCLPPETSAWSPGLSGAELTTQTTVCTGLLGPPACTCPPALQPAGCRCLSASWPQGLAEPPRPPRPSSRPSLEPLTVGKRRVCSCHKTRPVSSVHSRWGAAQPSAPRGAAAALCPRPALRTLSTPHRHQSTFWLMERVVHLQHNEFTYFKV